MLFQRRKRLFPYRKLWINKIIDRFRVGVIDKKYKMYIYRRNFIWQLIGASFGGMLGVILAIVTAATIYEIDDKLFLYMIVGAVIFAILCAVYDRMCSAIATFMVSFVALVLW